MASPLQQAVALMRSSSYWVALTGAGVSTASGIPDFRSERSGLWNLVDPLAVASLWGFHEDPERFYAWFLQLRHLADVARPNAAHTALARMEQTGRLKAVITQNIDSLHQRAGSRRVIELHGNARSATCLDCRFQITPNLALNPAVATSCPHCGGLVKPDVILFGEPLPYEMISAAQYESLACDVMLVAGTSLEVMPAADLPLLAQRRGAAVIVVNREPTPLDARADVLIRADVGKTLRDLWRALRRDGA